MKCSGISGFLGISNFLEEKSFPFCCFPLFCCIVHLRRLSYLSFLFYGILHSHWYIFPFLVFFLFPTICKVSSDNHFVCLHFFFGGDSLITNSCTLLHTSIHSSLVTLSDLIPWIFLSLPLYNHKGFELGHTWVAWWFSLLLSILVWILQYGVHDLSHSQFQVLFLLTL